MHEALFQTWLACGVGDGGQPYQAIFEQIDSHGVHRSHQNIQTQIVLVSVDQVRLWHVLRHNIAAPLAHLLLFSDNTNPFATTCRNWLHNVHVFEIAHFTINLPSFVIFGENVRRRTNVEGFAVETSHSLHITPHVIFAANWPTARKMVNVLHGADILEPTLAEKTSPHDIVRSIGNVSKPGHFKRIYHTVVRVSRRTHLESRRRIRFQLLLCVLHNAGPVFGQSALFSEKWWIGEENVGLSGRKNAINQRHDLVWRSP